MTDCACIYVGNYDAPSVCTSRVQRAKKEYRCGECGEAIVVGSQYEYTFGVWDEQPDTHRTCLDCVSIRDAFFCDGYIYGEVLRNLEEHIIETCRYGDGISSACITPLTPKARALVCDMIEAEWDEWMHDNNICFSCCEEFEPSNDEDICSVCYKTHKETKYDAI